MKKTNTKLRTTSGVNVYAFELSSPRSLGDLRKIGFIFGLVVIELFCVVLVIGSEVQFSISNHEIRCAIVELIVSICRILSFNP